MRLFIIYIACFIIQDFRTIRYYFKNRYLIKHKLKYYGPTKSTVLVDFYYFTISYARNEKNNINFDFKKYLY